MSKKIDRAAYGPKLSEVVLGAALSIVLGVALGVALLVLRPVAIEKATPKEIVPGMVYFIEGSHDASKAKQAAAKRTAFAAGQSVTVTEDELNLLAGPAPGTPPPAAKPGEKAKPAGKAAPAAVPPGEKFAVGTPNFRINGGALQVGVPVTIGMIDQKVMVQARGGFVKTGDVFTYEPDTLYFGSCPLQRLPFLAGYVRSKFLAAQPIPDDLKASWAKLANVAIEGNTLKLTMP